MEKKLYLKWRIACDEKVLEPSKVSVCMMSILCCYLNINVASLVVIICDYIEINPLRSVSDNAHHYPRPGKQWKRNSSATRMERRLT